MTSRVLFGCAWRRHTQPFKPAQSQNSAESGVHLLHPRGPDAYEVSRIMLLIGESLRRQGRRGRDARPAGADKNSKTQTRGQSAQAPRAPHFRTSCPRAPRRAIWGRKEKNKGHRAHRKAKQATRADLCHRPPPPSPRPERAARAMYVRDTSRARPRRGRATP